MAFSLLVEAHALRWHLMGFPGKGGTVTLVVRRMTSKAQATDFVVREMLASGIVLGCSGHAFVPVAT